MGRSASHFNEGKFLDDLRQSLRGWPLRDRLTVAVEPLTVAQWAADNAKVGIVGESGVAGGPASEDSDEPQDRDSADNSWRRRRFFPCNART